MRKVLLAFLVVFAFSAYGSPKADAFSDKDCGDFSSKQSLMDFWHNNGYSATNDPHRLDRDNDGLPCEVSSGEYSSYLANQNQSTTPVISQPTSGWKNLNGTWYYYSNGAAVKGWKSIGSVWYFFDGNGAMKTGWIYDGAWYYLNPDGSMATGWVYDGLAWYYLKSDGAMATGWVHDGIAWYYLTPSMATGWIHDGYAWYYMTPSMATNTVIEGYILGSDGTIKGYQG